MSIAVRRKVVGRLLSLVDSGRRRLWQRR